MSLIPDGYKPFQNVKLTEKAIKQIKDRFQFEFVKVLNLTRVSAPLFVSVQSGLNDGLSGVEKAVSFTIPAVDNVKCEIVHSLAKWKRMALKNYNFEVGEGIYTDMNAIRRQETLDNLHSVYVDQWDWEKILDKSERTEDYLRETVENIYSAIYHTSKFVEENYDYLKCFLPEKITFITAEELLEMYPNLDANAREKAFTKKHGAVFISHIGAKLADGKSHDMRAPDYDDWGLNGDILVWYPILDCAVELSSMGIRVDEDSIVAQLNERGVTKYSEYHKAIMNKEFPYTIGGGIGQSRLCLIMLQKAHIGEVHSSLWDNETIAECKARGVHLL